MARLSPSILAADFSKLGEQLGKLEESGISWVHIDVMDGKFVPSISFGMPVIQSIRSTTKLFFDVHLMIEEPIRYIEDFKNAGADLINIHIEACKDIGQTIEKIREQGCQVGVTLNPETPVEEIIPWIPMADLVLVMSVHPGFGGQKFLEESLEKIREIHKLIQKVNPSCLLEVDGGVHLQNVKLVTQAGADIIVAGTAIFRGDVKKNIEEFMKII